MTSRPTENLSLDRPKRDRKLDQTVIPPPDMLVYASLSSPRGRTDRILTDSFDTPPCPFAVPAEIGSLAGSCTRLSILNRVGRPAARGPGPGVRRNFSGLDVNRRRNVLH